jgi:hypothetical protein
MEDPAFYSRVTKAIGESAQRVAAYMVKAASNGNVRAMEILGKGVDPEFYNPPVVIDIRATAKAALESAGLPADDAAVDQVITAVTGALVTKDKD